MVIARPATVYEKYVVISSGKRLYFRLSKWSYQVAYVEQRNERGYPAAGKGTRMYSGSSQSAASVTASRW